MRLAGLTLAQLRTMHRKLREILTKEKQHLELMLLNVTNCMRLPSLVKETEDALTMVAEQRRLIEHSENMIAQLREAMLLEKTAQKEAKLFDEHLRQLEARSGPLCAELRAHLKMRQRFTRTFRTQKPETPKAIDAPPAAAPAREVTQGPIIPFTLLPGGKNGGVIASWKRLNIPKVSSALGG